MEPKAGLEPATTRLTGDNPILRPVEILYQAMATTGRSLRIGAIVRNEENAEWDYHLRHASVGANRLPTRQ